MGEQNEQIDKIAKLEDTGFRVEGKRSKINYFVNVVSYNILINDCSCWNYSSGVPRTTSS
jgi:hypothetical protein